MDSGDTQLNIFPPPGRAWAPAACAVLRLGTPQAVDLGGGAHVSPDPTVTREAEGTKSGDEIVAFLEDLIATRNEGRW